MLLKIDHLGEDIISERLPGIRELAKTFAGIDPVKEPIPVVPTCHYQMGGIPTNFHGQVVTLNKNQTEIVEGLFAAGECACVSVHGSNRLGTNSLLDLVVFGRAVGLFLENDLAKMPYHEEDPAEFERVHGRLNRWENSDNTEDPADIRIAMQRVMQESFGVFRDEKKMADGFKELEILQNRLQHAKLLETGKFFNMARFETLELDNLMATAVATAKLANNRTESRGAHSRYDYPKRDDENWLKHSIYFEDGRMGYRPVNMRPHDTDPIALREREG